MKRSILAIALTFGMSGMAMAQNAGTVTGSNAATAETGAAANLTQNYAPGYKNSSVSTVPALGTIITTPTVDCAVPVGVGGSFLGGGFMAGTAYIDQSCRLLEQARQVWNLGSPSTSLLMLCGLKSFRDARMEQGAPCPAFYGKTDAVYDQAAKPAQPTPDIVRTVGDDSVNQSVQVVAADGAGIPPAKVVYMQVTHPVHHVAVVSQYSSFCEKVTNRDKKDALQLKEDAPYALQCKVNHSLNN